MIQNYLISNKPKYLLKRKNTDSSEGSQSQSEGEYNQENFIMRNSKENSPEKIVYEKKKVIMRKESFKTSSNNLNTNTHKSEINFMPVENYTDSKQNTQQTGLNIDKLQEDIEAKVRREYQRLVQEKEKEIENRVKSEFENAMEKLKDQLQTNLLEEKKRLETELNKKWEEQYDTLLIECKSKLREDKEKQLAQNMYYKLKPTVEKEIYKKEFTQVEQKIRHEIEDKLKKEVTEKKNQELEKTRRKLEHYTNVTIEDIEKDLKNKYKENFEEELSKEIEKREKDLKVT
jgi:hypothetical protein